MADFALWATACETALWPAGTFTCAYAGDAEQRWKLLLMLTRLPPPFESS
jgi:hypothetical protein